MKKFTHDGNDHFHLGETTGFKTLGENGIMVLGSCLTNAE
jgi:hypothetical protein